MPLVSRKNRGKIAIKPVQKTQFKIKRKAGIVQYEWLKINGFEGKPATLAYSHATERSG